MSHYFITAIDTDAGKTVATALLAKELAKQSSSTITMKLVQTGCEKYSEDILAHRQIIGIDWQEVDELGLTCPYVFPHPASPHLAAAEQGVTIDIQKIQQAFQHLTEQYQHVLVEGVGGLMVPLNSKTLLSELLEQWQLPTILVTSSKLGSINHTLLSLSLIKQLNIPLYGVVYNHFPNDDMAIVQDSCQLLQDYLAEYFPKTLWGEMSVATESSPAHLLLQGGWFSTL